MYKLVLDTLNFLNWHKLELTWLFPSTLCTLPVFWLFHYWQTILFASFIDYTTMSAVHFFCKKNDLDFVMIIFPFYRTLPINYCLWDPKFWMINLCPMSYVDYERWSIFKYMIAFITTIITTVIYSCILFIQESRKQVICFIFDSYFKFGLLWIS